MIIDEETQTVEAHRIVITYGFTVDGTEWVSVGGNDEEISTPLLLGILEFAKHKILNPDEDEEEY